MLAGLITPRSLVQIQPSLLNCDSSLATRDLGNAEYFISNDLKQFQRKSINSTENLDFLLKNTYFLHKVKFFDWLNKKKLSQDYINGLRTTLENTLNLKFETPNDLKDVLLSVKNRKYRALALRNLFNFCEEYEILNINLVLLLKNKIKITEKSNIDSFVPSEAQIKDFLSKVYDYEKIGFIFLRILLDSGLRVTEVQHLLTQIDLDKFEINGDIVVYPLYYLRGTKSSYYVFLSLKTYNLIIEDLELIKSYNVEKLKTWIKRNNLIPLKYTRKYNFTQMIKAGISIDISNFIQGRISQNVGFNHYLAKKEIAIKEYKLTLC